MKRLILYILPLLLAACSQSEPASPLPDDSADQGLREITIVARAATLSRAYSTDEWFSNGWYEDTDYPVNQLFLTTYHRDNTGRSQYYFQDMKLTSESSGTDELWRCKGWYWPIQGEMQFLSYWSPRVYGKPEFREILHNDGVKKSAWMVVNAQGNLHAEGVSDADRYAGLDGYTDFLYIAEDHVPCPQSGTIKLTYRHGLAWIVISLHAEVLDAEGNVSDALTQELISKVKVNRVVIEKCARKAEAYLVPGKQIAWDIDPDDIKDQVYTRPKTFEGTPPPRGQYSGFTWYESDDGRVGKEDDDYITLSTTPQQLGIYTVDEPGHYTGTGLMIIPQHKTAIAVHYLISGGDSDGSDLEVVEKYEARDNTEEWEPGKLYTYDIIFRSSFTDLKKSNIETIKNVYEIVYAPDQCFDTEAFGQLYIQDAAGNQYLMPNFLLDTYRNQGSPFSDEMDYRDGGTVF